MLEENMWDSNVDSAPTGGAGHFARPAHARCRAYSLVPSCCSHGRMPSHKRLKVKLTLAKKQKQNRPIPQWIRLRTGNKIR